MLGGRWQVRFSSDHVLMTFSALLALCEGNPLPTGGFRSSRISYVGLWYFCYQSDKHPCLINNWVAGELRINDGRNLSFFMDWNFSFDINEAKTMTFFFSKCHIWQTKQSHGNVMHWCQINWNHLKTICDDYNEKIQLSLSNKFTFNFVHTEMFCWN